MLEMDEVGINLQQLSSSFGTVVIGLAIDGAAACELMVDYFKHMLRSFENIVVMPTDPCALHGQNRVVST